MEQNSRESEIASLAGGKKIRKISEPILHGCQCEKTAPLVLCGEVRGDHGGRANPSVLYIEIDCGHELQKSKCHVKVLLHGETSQCKSILVDSCCFLVYGMDG